MEDSLEKKCLKVNVNKTKVVISGEGYMEIQNTRKMAM